MYTHVSPVCGPIYGVLGLRLRNRHRRTRRSLVSTRPDHPSGSTKPVPGQNLDSTYNAMRMASCTRSFYAQNIDPVSLLYSSLSAVANIQSCCIIACASRAPVAAPRGLSYCLLAWRQYLSVFITLAAVHVPPHISITSGHHYNLMQGFLSRCSPGNFTWWHNIIKGAA